MASGVGDILFWGALSFALVVAGVVAYPVNRWLITRGKGHAVLHNSGYHPNFPTRAVGAVAVAAFIFGSSVLVAQGFSGESEMHGMAEEGGHGADASSTEAVPGLAVSANGLTLALDRTELPRGERAALSFRILDGEGRAVRDFEVEQDKRMHLIVVRRDTQGFQHLHPRMDRSGRWSTPVTLPAAGSYRVFADFQRGGEKSTLGADLAVDGPVDWQPLPAAATTDRIRGRLRGRAQRGRLTRGQRERARVRRLAQRRAGPDRALPRRRRPPRRAARGRPRLPPHPPRRATAAAAVRFATEFPSEGRYRLFFQFKHEGRVHTAAFTRAVAR